MITAAQRIPALQEGEVDIVARNMTINCDRWKQIAFSTEYYRSGQKILVRKGSKAKSISRPRGPEGVRPQGHLVDGQSDQAGAEGHPGRRRQPHRLPGAVPAGRGGRDHRGRHGAGRTGRPGPVRGGSRTEGLHRRAVRAGLQLQERRLRPVRQRQAGRDAQRRRVDQRSTTAGWPIRSGRRPARPRRSTAGTREHRASDREVFDG